MRNFVCQCGNCGVTPSPVGVSTGDGDRRVHFCSELHAAIWLIDQASYREQRDDEKKNAIVQAQSLFADLKRRSS